MALSYCSVSLFLLGEGELYVCVVSMCVRVRVYYWIPLSTYVSEGFSFQPRRHFHARSFYISYIILYQVLFFLSINVYTNAENEAK